MALATDLMLLLLDPQKGKSLADSSSLPFALSGAVLLDLALDDSIRISGAGESVRKGRVVPVGGRHEDPMLNAALTVLRDSRPMKPQSAVSKLSKGLSNKVFEQLRREHQIREVRDKIFGILPLTRRYPTDRSRRSELLAKLDSVLIQGTEPDERTAGLISLLYSVNAVHRVFPGADKKAIKSRAKLIANGEWASKAVKDAVEGVQAAIMAGVVAASAAAASGS